MQKKLFVALTILIFSFNANVAQAQETTLSVSPPTFDLTTSAGQETENVIKLINPNEAPINISVSARNFRPKGQEGQVDLTESETEYGIKDWVSFETTQVIVPAKSELPVKYKIKVPSNAGAGSHYGAVVFSTSGGRETDVTQVVEEIGVLILLNVPGDVKTSAQVVSFEPVQKVFTQKKVILNAVIENTGTVHVKPRGELVITNILGTEVKRVKLQERNVLQHTKRNAQFDFEFDGFGYYTAYIDAKYGDDLPLTAKTTFVAMPRAETINILVTLLAMIIIYVIFRRRIQAAVKALLKG